MFRRIKELWTGLNVLYKLLAVNTAVFLFVSFVSLIAFLLKSSYIVDLIVTFFSMRADLLDLLLHIWSPFTYMFLHQDFWHYFINMLWLYFMGLIFVMYFSQKKLWHVYLLGGLSGALLYVIFYNIFPAFSTFRHVAYLLGASAAISAIVLAVAVYRPTDNVYLFGLLKVPLWLIAVLYVLYDISMIPFDNAGGHISHLGGAAFGFYFSYKFKKGTDITAWLDEFGFNRKKVKMQVVKSDYRPDDYQWNADKKQIKQEVDRILEKISKHGYNSLTKKEREFLRKHSRDYD